MALDWQNKYFILSMPCSHFEKSACALKRNKLFKISHFKTKLP